MNKKIDELYKERFENFKVEPSKDLWSTFEQNPQWVNHIHKKKILNLSIYGSLFVAAAAITIGLIHHRNAVSEEVVEITADATAVEQVSETENQEQLAEIQKDDIVIKDEKISSTSAGEKAARKNVTAEESKTAVSNEPVTPEVSSTPVTSTVTTTRQNAEAASQNPAKSKIETQASTKSQTRTTEKSNPEQPVVPVIPQESSYESPFSIPNAFTPNGDGLNDVFSPQTTASISNYQLEIYTMGGQRLFVSRDLSYGWNGEYQGGLMNGGSYVYVVRHKDSSGKEHIDKGQLLLIR